MNPINIFYHCKYKRKLAKNVNMKKTQQFKFLPITKSLQYTYQTSMFLKSFKIESKSYIRFKK